MPTDTTEAALEACIRRIVNGEFRMLNDLGQRDLTFVIQNSRFNPPDDQRQILERRHRRLKNDGILPILKIPPQVRCKCQVVMNKYLA